MLKKLKQHYKEVLVKANESAVRTKASLLEAKEHIQYMPSDEGSHAVNRYEHKLVAEKQFDEYVSVIRFIGSKFALVQVRVNAGLQKGKFLRVIDLQTLEFLNMIKPASQRATGGDHTFVDGRAH